MRHKRLAELSYPLHRRGCVLDHAPHLGPSGLTLLDDSIYKQNGTLTNGAQFSPIGVATAVNLDGSNDYGICTPSRKLVEVLNSNVFSVSLWCYVRSFANSPAVWSVQTSASNDSGLLEFNATGSQLYVKTANDGLGLSGARTYTLSPAVSVNTWIHICFTKTGTGDNGNLYINGVLQTSYTGSFLTCVVTTAYRIYYGCYAGASVFLNGAVDSMMIHDRPLLSASINQLRLRRAIVNETVIRHRSSVVAASFKPAWASQRSQLIGGGIR